ncbi:hypothetical protein BKI52_09325 [marine bacterium AO1-C]|nr:hypothetical protein BKI52_09325 [marine bacterium AO1-C]
MSLSIKSFLSIFLVSWLPFCESNTSEKLLTKKWKFASIDEVRKASSISSDDIGKNTKDENEELNKMLQDIYNKASYEFRKDKQYIITKQNKVDKGTWEFANDGRQIIVTDNKGQSTILYIKDLTESKLTLANTADTTGRTLTLIPF